MPKMSFIDRWFLKMSKRAWENGKSEEGYVRKPKDLQLGFGRSTWNMLVHEASGGGYAVEFVKYDVNTDSTSRDLYVFGDDTKLGDGLSQVITLHALKNS